MLAAALLVLTLLLPVNFASAEENEYQKYQEFVDGIPQNSADPKRGLGLQPTPPGDYPEIQVPGPGEPLEASVDLSSELPPIGNQGAQGSCVGWATSYYYKSWSESQEHTSWDLTNSWYQYSPAFVYNQINGGFDSGAYFDDAFEVMELKGDIDIADMPYSQYDYLTQPTAAQLEAAKVYRIQNNWSSFWENQYYPPNNNPIEDVKTWLDSGKILVLGIPVYRDFPGYAGNPSSLYYVYNGYSSMAGGHAVTICGYDDNINPEGSDADHQGGFKMANSWGSGWNSPHGGYVYLSYDFVRRYVWEAWSMTNISPDTPVLDSLSSTSGNVGATINSSGNNFGTNRRGAKVSFNGTDATEVSFTNEEVSVVVPQGATSGPVAVYDWEGTASNTIEFTVGIPEGDPPTVTSISPNQGDNTGSVNVSVSGTNFLSGCQVRLTRSGEISIMATGENTVSAEQIDCTLNLSAANLGAWNVVVSNPDGQSGTLTDGFTIEGISDTYEPNGRVYQSSSWKAMGRDRLWSWRK